MASIKRICSKCHEEFLIIEQEKAFLDEKGLPEPKECPTCRQNRRLSLRSEQKLYSSTCDKCGKDIIIAFKPPEDQKVFCKECYLKYFETFDPVKPSED
ncbi:MAG: zinc-ribbon domain containing protein [Patescibacteria group bacterium]|nr:zinc-ribbon domain containing protein [Patescibacteria group bacterium]